MWYFYPCPKCAQPISVYDNEPDASYDVVEPLEQAIKDHYTKEHEPNDLLLTDEELEYEIKNNKQSSPTEPTW